MNFVFRKLRADEIDVRCGTVSEKGSTWLLYKDARVDMNLLDEVVGWNNWQREHKEIKGVCYCGVSIWDKEKSQWITKWDAGKESQTEAEKGEASDSFKRACVNATGVGRELYTAPFIFISKDELPVIQYKDKYVLVDKLARPEVSHIAYDNNGVITELKITYKGNEIYSYPKYAKNSFKGTKEPRKEETKVNTQSSDKLMTAEQLQEFVGFGFTLDQLIKKFNKPTTQITYEEMESILRKVRK